MTPKKSVIFAIVKHWLMKNEKLLRLFKTEIQGLFTLKKTDRDWRIPILAALCIGIPLLVGYYFNNVKWGLQASLAGLVILYIPTVNHLVNQMAIMLICSFGFLISFMVGLVFSFHPLVSALLFGVFSALVHWLNLYFKTKPPGSFFFIMLASMASGLPHNMHQIPEKIGLVALGTMLACVLALLFGLLAKFKVVLPNSNRASKTFEPNLNTYFVQASLVGIFMFLSMVVGFLFHLPNPYWIPISCLAVMQGVSLYHIWQRVFHRILGTFVGLVGCWIIVSVVHHPLYICFIIILLQFIIEVLIVRHYALAVVFITPMTILLAEAGNPIIQNPDLLFSARLVDIAIGSLIGAIGGWFIYNEKFKAETLKKINEVKLSINKKK